VDKPSSEKQFYKLDMITLLEKSGATALVLLGLMQGRLADEIVLNIKKFKIIYQIKYSKFYYV